MNFSILDTIGNTPLVEIQKINPNPKVRIFAKLEYFNPGGSIKDRPALAMILDGEKSGKLTRDKIVIEATSGNTGIGLAMVCAVKGYRLLLAMSEAVSVERRKILTARGAEILLTPGHLGTDGAIEEVYRLVREDPDRYFMTDQFNNDANWMSHYHGTANEIIRQTDGKISKVIATMGTTGTVMGLAKRFREYDPNIQVIGVEPYLGHKLQGLKNLKEAYRPEIFDKNMLDVKVNIEDEDAFEMTRRLGKEEGLLVGMSSGAAMVIAVREAQKMENGAIVVIFSDSGERYLSTPLFEVKKKVDIQLFNTMKRAKEPFEPIHSGKVTVYSCGPTAYARMNAAECRRYIFSDILCRYLEFRGYDVHHIMNITDFDDKTIQGSEDAGEDLTKFTQKYIDLFKQDLETLQIQPAQKYPKASEHISDMAMLAQQLMEKGAAYEKLRSLYFNIAGFPEYGKLSGIDLDKIKLGATVDLDEYEKNNPKDFTLLKRARLSDLKRGIYVKTEWGNVRPSWHIQCAAMSMKHLGETFDIHASSRDLLFPHHENVLAIAKAITGKPLSKYWLHCEGVSMEEKDAGGSRVGLPAVFELIQKGYTPREIRFWIISSHYRKPLAFSEERLLQSRNALKRLDACMQSLMNVTHGLSFPEIDQIVYDVRQGFINAMDDDLDFPLALAGIFKSVKQINKLIEAQKISPDDASKILKAVKSIDAVVKIFEFKSDEMDAEIRSLLKERDLARKSGDFELADKIRDQLRNRGIMVHDTKI
ncbi:MAG: cysteine--tRNA ligase [Desulfobacterales bacterium]|jgi:cysteinyl-tRNA synthetase|nr:cysteine--tRNA ligase [Desulfobacterales bacterium]